MTKDFVCQECGEHLPSGNTYHTYESCQLFKLNETRCYLGKLPIVIDIEVEDKVKANR